MLFAISAASSTATAPCQDSSRETVKGTKLTCLGRKRVGQREPSMIIRMYLAVVRKDGNLEINCNYFSHGTWPKATSQPSLHGHQSDLKA